MCTYHCSYEDVCCDKDVKCDTCANNPKRSYYRPVDPPYIPYVPHEPYYPWWTTTTWDTTFGNSV